MIINEKQDEAEMRGYWGKYHRISGEMRKIYIGIMTREEMLENFPEFRHNFTYAIRPDGKGENK